MEELCKWDPAGMWEFLSEGSSLGIEGL